MSDGTINLPERAASPAPPSVNRHKIFVDNNGVLSTVDDMGVVTTYSSAATSVFGDNHQFIDVEIAATYSVLTPTVHLTLVTGNLPLGTYRLGFNFSWKYDDQTGNAAHFNINDNGVPHLPTDITMETKNIFDNVTVGSFFYLENISGVRTIELTVHCDDIADILTVNSAYLEIWRAY